VWTGPKVTLVSRQPFSDDLKRNLDALASFGAKRADVRFFVPEDPHGLNGFILLLHVGAGPRRADKFHQQFEALVHALAERGYRFVRIDELLKRSSAGHGPSFR